MKTVEIHLRASIAKPSDYGLVARLCRRAVGARDYALLMLRENIDDNGLFLAWNDDKLVGMTNFDRCIDGTGWLSVARTDPDWRGMGVALFLQQQIAAHARRLGVRVLRLWTSSRNRPSISACRKGGFKPVCEASHVSCRIRTARKHKQPDPLRSVSKGFLSSFLRSGHLTKTNGYMAYKRHFTKASTLLLEKLHRKRELYLVGRSVFILTKPERIFYRLQSTFTLLDGPVASSLKTVKELAKRQGVNVVGGYIAHDPYQLSVARDLGFRVDPWGNHCIVFEKAEPQSWGGHCHARTTLPRERR